MTDEKTAGIRAGEYWWTQAAEDVASQLQQNHANVYTYGTNPISQAWLRNSIAYYSTVLEAADWSTGLSFQGDQGELIKMCVPQARSLMRQMISLVCKQRLAFNAIAESMGSDVAAETRIGNALSVQIVEEQKLDLKSEKVAEHAGILGMGFYKVTWRTDKGRPFAVNMPDNVTGTPGQHDDDYEKPDPDKGPVPPKIEYDGNLEISTPNVWDVYFDARLENWEDNDWVEVRTMKNRWDLICQFPALHDAILALPKILTNSDYHTGQRLSISQDDMIYVYEVFHKLSPVSYYLSHPRLSKSL